MLMCVMVLSACDGQFPPLAAAPTGDDAADVYDIARTAAENGDFDMAIEHYEKALVAYPRGKDGAALRIEYATVLLYSDRPKRALEVARTVPELTRDRDLRGEARVQEVIAQHELTRRFLAGHPPYETARDRARRTYTLMEDTIVENSQFDPDGVLLARLVLLREDLARIEIRKMRAEVASGKIMTAAQRSSYIQFEFGDTEVVQQEISDLRRISSALQS